MFFKKNTDKDVDKEKELIDRELVVYKKEKLAEITLAVARAQELGATQEREYECKWHGKRADLDVEIAKLEAKKESYTSLLEERNKDFCQEHKAVVAAKDQTIEILEKALKALTEKLPKDFNQTTINNK